MNSIEIQSKKPKLDRWTNPFIWWVGLGAFYFIIQLTYELIFASDPSGIFGNIVYFIGLFVPIGPLNFIFAFAPLGLVLFIFVVIGIYFLNRHLKASTVKPTYKILIILLYLLLATFIVDILTTRTWTSWNSFINGQLPHIE